MGSDTQVNILIVDDKPENLLALDAILSDLDATLVRASSGEDALRCLLQQEFAVILLDVCMPGLDGFKTADLIKSRPQSRNTPIIFLTAVDIGEVSVAQGYLAGAVDYMIKPLVPAILRTKVRVFVDLYRQTAQIRQLNADLARRTAQLETAIGALEADIAARQRVAAALRVSEEEVRALNADLEHRVLERTSELQAANAALQKEIAARKRVEAVLRELSILDELTGIPNRRELNRLLRGEFNRSRRYARPLSLIMLDIDHFKDVNDTYGHPAGDAVLRWMATTLGGELRATDRLARYGGEEFAILLPETPARTAFHVAEGLRHRIAAAPFTLEAEPAPLTISITISLGVAGLTAGALAEDDLVQAADLALYEAKRRGRNRTVAFAPALLAARVAS
ncbi:MAG TPA: diguanylate cyclase [Chloroflexia bacterium]|nr:diguanylate cyclase [Chloroflexia bacterium]